MGVIHFVCCVVQIMKFTLFFCSLHSDQNQETSKIFTEAIKPSFVDVYLISCLAKPNGIFADFRFVLWTSLIDDPDRVSLLML